MIHVSTKTGTPYNMYLCLPGMRSEYLHETGPLLLYNTPTQSEQGGEKEGLLIFVSFRPIDLMNPDKNNLRRLPTTSWDF